MPGVIARESIADRKPTARKRRSSVGFAVNPSGQQQIYFESSLEYWCLITLLARPDVISIKEQQRVRYFDGQQQRTHYFDFVVTWVDGSRTAFAVKYHADAIKTNLSSTLELISQSHREDVADWFSMLTEHHVDRLSIRKAEFIVQCSLDRDTEGKARVREYLKRAKATVTLRELSEQVGLAARGYRASVALLREGCLTLAPELPISDHAPLTNNLRAENRS